MGIKIWHKVNVNRSNRPILRDNEEILYVRDNVGLYQGKVKITNRQFGRLYLTNVRIIYIDNIVENSLFLEISGITRTETIDGFLKRSPKVKIYFVEDLQQDSSLDWVCKICSYNNHLPKVDMNSLPPCVSCGIPPTRKYIETLMETLEVSEGRDDQCSKCTFINHPSLKYCEMCGSELKSKLSKALTDKIQENPLKIELEDEEAYSGDDKYIKISFRMGGETKFNNLLVEILETNKWDKLIQSGNVNKDSIKVEDKVDTVKGSGIYRLELLSEQTRKNNEITLSNSLEDVEQLMFKYQDLIKLSNSFNKLIKPIKTYPKIKFNIDKNSKVYYEELSKFLSEYLTSYKLIKSSSMITLQDLFADFNKFLILNQGIGIELISSNDFMKSIEYFDKLGLPIIYQTYESTGLRILKPKFNENVSQLILKFLKTCEIEFFYQKYKLIYQIDKDNYLKDNFKFFKGNTISEISEEFNWSNNITIEELDKLVNEGLVVIDNSIMGTFYFLNKFIDYEEIDTTGFEERLQQEQVERLQLEAQQLKIATDKFGSKALFDLKGINF